MPRDTDGSDTSRRRFLKATGAAALTSAVAGCGSDGGDTATPGDGGDDGGDGTDTGTDTGPVTVSEYPYGVGETMIGEAQRVMEEAGYGPDDRFELDWLQYESPTWSEMASTIASRLESAHIDMNQSSAAFSPLLEATRNGNHEAYTLGWVADYPGPQNFVQLVDPRNTVYDENAAANGARLFWSEDAEADPEVRQYMIDQFERISNNPEDTEEAAEVRGDAAVKMEEGMWQEAALIPIYQGVTEAMWYDHVDYNPPGPMEPSRAKTSNSVAGLEGKDRLSTISSTFSSLDPIASGNTASGGKIMDMFDALTNYVNGTTEVENLLAEGYEVSEDFRTYTFTLKEGATFHNGEEVTAQDFEYSIKRLMVSDNSTNARFPVSVMGIEHETEEVTVTDDEGDTVTDTASGEPETTTRIIPDSIGVEAVDDYTLEITTSEPFAFSLSVLAYSAFSAVPEGIVGDVEGYDGEMEWEEFSQSPVGAGPFEFVNWESGNGGEIVMDTFDDYHGEGASFDGIDAAILTETQARYNYFLNENADIGGVPTAQYNADSVTVEETDDVGRDLGTYDLENGTTVNYARTPEIGTFYVGFNMEQVPRPVRQAMAYVINQPEFMANVFKDRFEPAYHLTPPQIFPGGIEAYDEHVGGSE
ncbi:ABC transporter substrate-binding protein [Halosimplex halophilum]|uniref:ABC transporter substrate-binding protein n=1 Tax=Halosimplex halophilum TaxID=2559572 RepID=UPI00107F4669|nr:ABC transporter substrate-binding protein [Halosimplex halophilum]